MPHADARSRLTETLLWLCRIASPIGEERALCDAVSERLGRLPLAGPIRRHGDSIVVPVSRGSRGPRVALAGHLDVVRTSHDGPVRVEGERLYGPGASDMKSGLALMIDLVERDLAACAGIDLSLVFYAREEGPFIDNELGRVLDDDPELKDVDFVICLEPSDNKLSLGASGSLHARLTFEGRTAHSARPWQGDNAIHKAGPLLVELGARAPREAIIDGHVYRTVTSVTLAEGGRARNIVPDAFSINLNHRFSPDTSIAEAKAEVIRLVDGRARIDFHDESPAALPHARHPLVVAMVDAGVVAVEPKQAWTDVARFAVLGIVAVNFGPGENAQAHQRNEWTHLPKLAEGREILLRWLDHAGSIDRLGLVS
jgi:succinyl-diaminopimelate desuccinylase